MFLSTYENRSRKRLFVILKKQMELSNIPNISFPKSNQFLLIAGPCAIEGEEMALNIAEKILRYTDELKIPFVFKGS